MKVFLSNFKYGGLKTNKINSNYLGTYAVFEMKTYLKFRIYIPECVTD